jgi:type IV pilus assembly protein PilA
MTGCLQRTFPKENGQTTVKRQRGFSLVELIVVVAVILIIMSIAVPGLLRNKMTANEASAVQSMRNIATTNAIYYSRYDQGYAGTLAQLGPAGGGCAGVGSGCADLLDSVLSGVAPSAVTPLKAGYQFTYSAVNAVPATTLFNSTFSIVATPILHGVTGTSTFCLDQTSTIRKDRSGTKTTAPASGCAASWPIGGTIGPP